MTNLSPLASSDPNSIDLLFSSNPTELTPGDITKLVTELRRRRNVFLAEEAAKASKPAKAKKDKPSVDPTTAAKLDKPAGELTLDDLM